MTGRLFASAVGALALAAAASCGELTMSVAPATVELGETVQLTLSLQGANPSGSPRLELPDAAAASGPQVLQRHTIVNGRATRSVDYVYRVSFSKAGAFTLGPAEMETSAGALRSGVAQVAVRGAGQSATIAIEARLGAERVYVGQPVTAELVFGVAREVAGYEINAPFLEDRDGLRRLDPENLVERWNEARQRGGLQGHAVLRLSRNLEAVAAVETRAIDGVPYTAYVVRRVLVPTQPGRYEFAPARAMADVVVGRATRSRDPFDSFFADSFFAPARQTKTFSVASGPALLDVLPLPSEGRPAGFEGAVGRFHVEASVSPDETPLGGQPFMLRVKVSGTGNIEAVSMPRLTDGRGLRAGLPEMETVTGFRDGRLVGERVFTVPIRPSSDELTRIPPLELVAFDPELGRYVVERTEPLPVKVTVPKDSGAIRSVQLPENARDVAEPAKRDIEDIDTDVPAMGSQVARLHRPIGLIVFGLLPTVAAAGALAHSRRWRAAREDSRLARRLAAGRNARARLAEAEATPPAEFAQAVSKALQQYLADRIGRPGGEMSPAEAAECGGAGVARLLEVAEGARFGGAEIDRDEFLALARACVDEIESGVKA